MEVLPKHFPPKAKVQTTSSRRARSNLRAKAQMVQKARDYTNTQYRHPD